jgi:hypothetical protein
MTKFEYLIVICFTICAVILFLINFITSANAAVVKRLNG